MPLVIWILIVLHEMLTSLVLCTIIKASCFHSLFKELRAKKTDNKLHVMTHYRRKRYDFCRC